MKKKFYLTLDTETATLPFANQIAKNATQKQKIAIAKPLVYDIGWVITDRTGEVIKKVNYLVQETFFVPNVFNTAYYCDKRPIYMDLLVKKEIFAKNWNDIIEELLLDLEYCDIATAYNACFDYKKAIPFTEKYIYHLYNTDYNDWEKRQYRKCLSIIQGKDKSKNENYLEPWFELRGKRFPIVDLWGVACTRLINIDKYRDYCLENRLVTKSVEYFKSSAETSFQYLMKNHDFIEDHTALSDAMIEAQILTKALKKGKVEPELRAFPFRELGTTVDYVTKNQKKKKYKKDLTEMLFDYVNNGCGFEPINGYWARMISTYEMLENAE